jgi:hypothetical protein
MRDDSELLRLYADEKSDEAFAELVRRHIGLVYAVAKRRVGGDAHLAEDVAQEDPPYRNARVLFTNFPGTKVDSKTAHGTAIANKTQAVFRKTWIYMLTTPTGSNQELLTG